jgi:hypothetical protein
MATHFDAGLGGLPPQPPQTAQGATVAGASGVGLDFGFPPPRNGATVATEAQSFARAMAMRLAAGFFVR